MAQDSSEVVKLLREAADKGNADAQYQLGSIYASGRGVPRDDAEAAKWYRLAAEQGKAFAQTCLAGMYAGGHGVPQDYTESLKWRRRAAEQGDVSAQHALGSFYSGGCQGVPQDYVQALKWYNLAVANHPDPRMREVLGKVRDYVASKMTPFQTRRARQLSAEWRPKPERPEER